MRKDTEIVSDTKKSKEEVKLTKPKSSRKKGTNKTSKIIG